YIELLLSILTLSLHDALPILSRINPSNPVYDVAAQRALGFIPSGWYPSALAVIGDNLLVATAKGEGTGPNNGPNAVKQEGPRRRDRKSTRLNSSHDQISYAVF